MQSHSRREPHCEFDAASRRCRRCGYAADSLPFFRVCRTLEEEARHLVEKHATSRIAVPPVPLGDAAAAILTSIGVTKERMKAAIGRECGCASRQAKLNEVGRNISAAVEGLANRVLNATLPRLIEEEEVADVANALARQPGANSGLLDAASASKIPALTNKARQQVWNQ